MKHQTATDKLVTFLESVEECGCGVQNEAVIKNPLGDAQRQGTKQSQIKAIGKRQVRSQDVFETIKKMEKEDREYRGTAKAMARLIETSKANGFDFLDGEMEEASVTTIEPTWVLGMKHPSGDYWQIDDFGDEYGGYGINFTLGDESGNDGYDVPQINGITKMIRKWSKDYRNEMGESEEVTQEAVTPKKEAIVYAVEWDRGMGHDELVIYEALEDAKFAIANDEDGAITDIDDVKEVEFIAQKKNEEVTESEVVQEAQDKNIYVVYNSSMSQAGRDEYDRIITASSDEEANKMAGEMSYAEKVDEKELADLFDSLGTDIGKYLKIKGMLEMVDSLNLPSLNSKKILQNV